MKDLFNAALEEAYKQKIKDLYASAFTSALGENGNIIQATQAFTAGANLAEQLYTLLKKS